MPDPKPQLSPEKQKQLKEATAFINDKVKKPGKFSIPKDMLDLLVESGEIKDVPKPEITKQESKPRSENQDITPELQEMVSQARRLNQGVFTNCYNDLFPEHIPTPNFSPETMEFIRKGELAPFYLPEIDLGDIGKLDPSVSITTGMIPQTIPLWKRAANSPHGLFQQGEVDIYYSKLKAIFPNWCLPNKGLFELAQKYIKTQSKEGISPDSLKLTNQWVVIEKVQKPNYDDGEQRYLPTELMKQVADLMNQDDINYIQETTKTNILIGDKLTQGDRIFLKWSEITGIKVDDRGKTVLDTATGDPIRTNQGIADYAEKVLNTKVSLPTFLQWNLLANMLIHSYNLENNLPIQKPDPDLGLGSTNTWEWNNDERFLSNGDAIRLASGYSADGGLSGVSYGGPLGRSGIIGFRFLGVSE